MQNLINLESENSLSLNEYVILTDHLNFVDEDFRDVNERIRSLEVEFNELRNEMERKPLESKMEFEERINKLTDKFQQREDEWESLHNRLSEILQLNSMILQAIENLEAGFAGDDTNLDDDIIEDDDEDAGDAATPLKEQFRLLCHLLQ